MIRVIREGKRVKVEFGGENDYLYIKRLNVTELVESRESIRKWLFDNPDATLDQRAIEDQYKVMLKFGLVELGPSFVDEEGKPFELKREKDGKVTEEVMNDLLFGCGLYEQLLLIGSHLAQGIPSVYATTQEGEIIKGVKFCLGEPEANQKEV